MYRSFVYEKGLWALSLVLMISASGLIFLYAPTEKEMGEIQRIFYFHVPIAWIAFLAFFIVFVGSILFLWKRDPRWDTIAHCSAEIGVVFTTLVLVTGSIWGRSEWDTWWNWEPRLTASLVLWFTYVAYLMVRAYADEESRGARFASVLGIIGFVNVPMVYLAVKFGRTLHPPELVSDLAGSMLFTLLVSVAAFSCFFVVLLRQSTRIKNMNAQIREMGKDLDEKEMVDG